MIACMEATIDVGWRFGGFIADTSGMISKAAVSIAVLPFVGRKKPEHFRRRIGALGIGIRTGRIAPEPGMAPAVHQPLLGEDTNRGALQHRPRNGIPPR